jgi:hypothetical protein
MNKSIHPHIFFLHEHFIKRIMDGHFNKSGVYLIIHQKEQTSRSNCTEKGASKQQRQKIMLWFGKQPWKLHRLENNRDGKIWTKMCLQLDPFRFRVAQNVPTKFELNFPREWLEFEEILLTHCSTQEAICLLFVFFGFCRHKNGAYSSKQRICGIEEYIQPSESP